jgi:endonuclease YncB( thermonuclease family)
VPQGSWFVPRLCLLCAAACTGLSAAARADSDLPGPIPAALVRVIDGDTIEVRARIWLDLDLTTRVRLAGIDAPELNGACSEERRRAEEAQAILAEVLGAGPVWLAGIQRDKYGGRVVADVLTLDGRSASAAMLAVRGAVEWGTAKAWCLD